MECKCACKLLTTIIKTIEVCRMCVEIEIPLFSCFEIMSEFSNKTMFFAMGANCNCDICLGHDALSEWCSIDSDKTRQESFSPV